MRITGKTQIMFILADPVDHIVGTDMFNTKFAEQGFDVACSALHVSPDSLHTVMNSLRHMRNVVGTGCTIPHKIAATKQVDELTPEAASIGAVNFVRRNPDGTLLGHNVDGIGFMAGLAANNVDVSGRRVLQIGAGGVGRAIAFSLAKGGAEELVIANRHIEAANELAEAIMRAQSQCKVTTAPFGAEPPAEEFDLVVNCTSLGKNESDPMPFDPSRLTSKTVVAEVVMTPAVTPVMAFANERGCKTIPGRAMLEPQAALVAEFFQLK